MDDLASSTTTRPDGGINTLGGAEGWLRHGLEYGIALLIGGWLRFHQLFEQIVADDEWHAVRIAVQRPYREILLRFSASGSIPLELFYKVVADSVGLTEKLIRFPAFVAGMLTLVVLPWLVRDEIDARGRKVFTFLLVISPMLVYYSRYARPYSASVLLTFLGLIAFYRWWTGRHWAWAAAYVACAVLAPYLHLTAAATLAAPFAFAAVDWLRQRRSGRPSRSLAALVVVGLAASLGLGLAVGPPLLHDFASIDARAGETTVEALTFVHTAALLAGTPHVVVGLVFVLAALAGGALLFRGQPRFVLYLGWACLTAVLASIVSQAAAIRIPIVFARYTLVLLPVSLLFVAVAGARAGDRLEQLLGRLAPAAAGLVAVAVLFVQGPLPRILRAPNSWTNHAIFQYSYDPLGPYSYVHEVQPQRIPELYRQLAQHAPGSLVIAEAPWYYEWHNNPLPFYQEIHRQRVKAGLLGGLCRQQGAFAMPVEGAGKFRLRNVVEIGDSDRVSALGIDYVVVHKNLRNELRPRAFNVRRVPPSNIPRTSRIPECLDRLRALYGPVVFEDRDIVAFALTSADPSLVADR